MERTNLWKFATRTGRVAVALLAAVLVPAQPRLTTIQDTLYKADGTRFNGILVISWNSFESGNLSNIVSQSLTVKVVEGNFRVQLVPTTDSNPPTYYNVKYNSDGKIQFTETWVVGASTTPLRIRDVRAAPSSTITPLPPPGQTPIQETDIVGLAGDLALRPVKGPGYGPGHAAIINDSGGIDAVIGNPGDCVLVDGTSGPCGTSIAAPQFVDAEVLTGVIDGSNPAFTLANSPNPPASLMLFRNGMAQKAGLDFTLSGQAVTFLAGAVPQPGDKLLAWYRLGAGSQFADAEVPAGVIDGANATFTLANTPNPPLSLVLFRNGLAQKPAVDFTLSGSTISFLTGATPQTGDTLVAWYRLGAGPQFADAEIPAGVINGANATFTLANTPNPPLSLVLFRNGIAQKPAVDFTLSGSTITFLTGATPQTGDTLLAWYRLAVAGGLVAGGLTAAGPQITCSAAGSSTSSTNFTSLGNCTFPANVLGTGDRVEIHFDLAHQGTAAAFEFQVLWGSTVLVDRAAPALEVMIAGKGESAVYSGGAQLRAETWGTALAYAAAVANAADSVVPAFTIDFQAKMAQATSETVSLRNFTVVRYPMQ